MSNVCFGIAGYLFGHDYSPRITLAFPNGSIEMKKTSFDGTAAGYERMVNSWKNQHYHGDVCTRCGHTVNAPKESP